MYFIANVNLLSGLSFVFLISLTRFLSSPIGGFLPLDASTLFPIADWAIMHTALIKMLEQSLFKGITAFGFILQYKERIMAIILAIMLAKRQMGNCIAQVTMASFLIRLNKLYTGLAFLVTLLMNVETSKYMVLRRRLWNHRQRSNITDLVLNCPSLS
jgi:hypothetical protein